MSRRKPNMPVVDMERWAINLNRDLGEAQATISQLQAEIARYREALKPFAEYGRLAFVGTDHDEDFVEIGIYADETAEITVKDFRNAAALGGSND